MVEWTDASHSPGRFQWENSSGNPWASQSNNCGPTSVTKIADFYNDTLFGIEQTRYLATGCCQPTTCSQQSVMMAKRGVPNRAMYFNTLGEIDAMVGWDGRRPILIGMLMSRVPYGIKDHPFDGWHAVAVLKQAERNGVSGYLINDPNFSPAGGYRPDPDHGVKFYPRWALDYAFIQNAPRWGVAPYNPKEIVVPSHRILGDPMDQRKLFVDELGKEIVIKGGKPVRAGFLVKDRTLRITSQPTRKNLVGRIVTADLPQDEKQFGPVFVVNMAVRNGKSRHGYVKGIDIVTGSYK